MSARFILYYNQPTITNGKIVPGTTWYARKRPGDGGVDWEYTSDRTQAGAFSEHWRRRWFKLHGAKARASEGMF